MSQTLMFHGITSAELERRPEDENWLSLILTDVQGDRQVIDVFAYRDSAEVVCEDLTLIAESEQEEAA